MYKTDINKTNKTKANKQPPPKERSNKGVFSFLVFIIIVIVVILIYYFIRTTKTGTEPEPIVPQYYFKYKDKYNIVPDFTDYDEETFGVNKYSWDTDSNGLKECSKFFINSCRWADDNILEITLQFMTNWGNFIEAVYNELEKTYYDEDVLQVIPWGEDWKPFGFEFTLCCCYYVLHKYANSSQKMIAATVSNKIIRSPKNIMANTDLKDFEIMELCFQYAVGRKHTRTFDPKNEDYLYGISYYILKYDLNNEYKEQRNGIQIDGSYIYDNEVTFKYLPYLLENWYEMKQITEIYNVPVGIDLIKSKFLSKNFTISQVPQLWHSNANFTVEKYTGERKENEIEIFPLAGICIYKTSTSLLTLNLFKHGKIMARVTEETKKMGSQYYCINEFLRNKDKLEIIFPFTGYATKFQSNDDSFPPEEFPIGDIISPEIDNTIMFSDNSTFIYAFYSFTVDNVKGAFSCEQRLDIPNKTYYIHYKQDVEIYIPKIILHKNYSINERILVESINTRNSYYMDDYRYFQQTDIIQSTFYIPKDYAIDFEKNIVTYKGSPAIYCPNNVTEFKQNIELDGEQYNFDVLLNQWVTQNYLEMKP